MTHETDNFYGEQYSQIEGERIPDDNPELDRLKLENENLRLRLMLQNELNKQHHNHGGREYFRQRELPESIYPKIIDGKLYHNGDIGKDYYYRNIKKIRLTQNLVDGLHPDDYDASIELLFGNGMLKRPARINVNYEGEYAIFEYKGFTQSILLSRRNRNQPITLIFGDRIPERERGKRHGNFLEFTFVLGWR